MNSIDDKAFSTSTTSNMTNDNSKYSHNENSKFISRVPRASDIKSNIYCYYYFY